MRKISFYILVVIFLILTVSGCSNNGANSTVQIPAKFESDFNADYGRLKLSGHISKLDTGIYNVSITSPKSIENLKINCVGGQITTLLDNISFDIDAENLPVSGFIAQIANLLDTVTKSSGATITVAEGYNKYSALLQDGNSYILQDQKSGNITSLVIKHADISMNFIDFRTE